MTPIDGTTSYRVFEANPVQIEAELPRASKQSIQQAHDKASVEVSRLVRIWEQTPARPTLKAGFVLQVPHGRHRRIH